MYVNVMLVFECCFQKFQLMEVQSLDLESVLSYFTPNYHVNIVELY